MAALFLLVGSSSCCFLAVGGLVFAVGGFTIIATTGAVFFICFVHNRIVFKEVNIKLLAEELNQSLRLRVACMPRLYSMPCRSRE